MATLWFLLVALVLTVYVVLDGFDLGAGAILYLVGRSPDERRLVQKSIGPVWNGNEVWLVVAAGTLYFSFPQVYAAGFSGFYLPLMMVLWLLMLRAMGVELRGHVASPMWHALWDFVFAGSSALLAIFLGAALGNVVRGVPLDENGYFFEPLWTTFSPHAAHPGILDWYTVLTGAIALVALATHGANYVATKTEGDVQARARGVAGGGATLLAVLTLASIPATLWARFALLDNFRAHPVGLVFPIAVTVSLGAMVCFSSMRHDRAAFVASAGYIVSMLGGAAFALYPTLLPATTDPATRSLTVENAAAAPYGLAVGLVWWTLGFALALGYLTFLYRSFRGKVSLEREGY
jgi:cytochrome d ubiquinol oxidase subunit II